jgi:hypothetical protein
MEAGAGLPAYRPRGMTTAAPDASVGCEIS